ncbi:MAG: formate/nitrite transporter family protein [Alphaproteobacteria bacterium]
MATRKNRKHVHDHVAATNPNLSASEQKAVEERSRLPPVMVYEIVREEGLREVGRPVAALWWSGVAAGMTIGLSVLGEAILTVHLPQTDWSPLVAKFGYTAGFLIVILSRHQLFTESTITPILPLMVRRTWSFAYAVARLWLVVSLANLTGALIFAVFWTLTDITDAETLSAMHELGRHTMANDPVTMFIRAIGAGFLMASLVWVLPSAKEAAFWAVVTVIYLIALADFVHIVSGGVEVLLLVVAGEVSVFDFLLAFGVPAFVGNVIGGTALFSVIVYAEVRRELNVGDET